VLPNPTGTAPGMVWTPRPGFTVLTFPGVPSEMRAMWEETAEPWLRNNGLTQGVFASRTLHFWGLSESTLAERVADLLAGQNPTVAPYAGAGEVKLRLTAHADDGAAAAALLAPVECELRARTGRCCFGVDGQGLAEVVLDQLRRRGESLAVAESCTGGGIGAALAAVPGASDVFLGGVIAYANSVKEAWLDVPWNLLQQHGAVSDPVAAAMAEGVRRRSGSTWAVAVSGIAGPGGGTPEKPVGLVHIAVAGPTGCAVEPVRFGSRRGRHWIQTLAVGETLNRLRLRLAEPG
jgi:nicotinamide-nucleotide amidase